MSVQYVQELVQELFRTFRNLFKNLRGNDVFAVGTQFCYTPTHMSVRLQNQQGQELPSGTILTVQEIYNPSPEAMADPDDPAPNDWEVRCYLLTNVDWEFDEWWAEPVLRMDLESGLFTVY